MSIDKKNHSTGARLTTRATTRGISQVNKEAKSLLLKETEAGGFFHGLKIGPHIEPETVERLLKLAGKTADLNRARVRAAKEYGEDVL